MTIFINIIIALLIFVAIGVGAWEWLGNAIIAGNGGTQQYKFVIPIISFGIAVVLLLIFK